MSDAYNLVYDNLTVEVPENVSLIEHEPYLVTDSLEEQVRKTRDAINFAIRGGNTHTILIYVYYLGELIENNYRRKTFVKQKVSEHFYQAAYKTYHIFVQIGKEQIYRTKDLTHSVMRRLKSSSYKRLIQDAINIKIERQMQEYLPDTVLEESSFNGDVEI
jgi:hypothetical protein